MRKHINISLKTIAVVMVLTVVSCTDKDPCEYVTKCTENSAAGYMVVTMGGLTQSSPTAMILNTNPTLTAPVGGDWLDPSLGANQVAKVATAQLNVATTGQVFGIALDYSGGIYLSASNIYAMDGYGFAPAIGTGGSAGIYYTNFSAPGTTSTLVKTTNVASANTVGTALIPNTGGGYNSIGNIAYDKVNNQLFATNLEDGRIYRINPSNGIVLSIFDPFVLDAGVAGIAALGEQLWGVGVHTFSGVTSVFFARSNSSNVKEIWSIPLTTAGEFAATQVGATKLFNDTASSAVQEIKSVGGVQSKITDISFSSTGRMLLAERGNPHQSQVFEFVKSGITWGSGNNFYVGNNAGTAGANSAGGVDYGRRQITKDSFKCNDLIWASSNYMIVPSKGYFYGVEGMSATGNSATVINNPTTDLYIDYNGSYGTNDKGGIGDVEIFKNPCACD